VTVEQTIRWMRLVQALLALITALITLGLVVRS